MNSRMRLFAALYDPDYRLFFGAFLVNQTGFWVSHISLQALIAEKSSDTRGRYAILASSNAYT